MSNPTTLSPPTASERKEAIVEESKELHNTINNALKSQSGGAPVHVFDPDMPAQEKKDEMLRNANMPDITEPLRHVSTAEKKKADKTTKAASASGAYANEPVLINGLPDWYKVGWTGFSDLPNPGDGAAMAKFAQHHSENDIKQLYNDRSRSSNGEYSKDLIAQFVSEKFFGEWYHNCAVVLIAIFFTWLLSKFRFGLMSCLIVGAFFATYYRTSIKRTRRNMRDDIQREVTTNRLDTDIETVGWMNHFLDRFWLIFEPVLSAQVIGQVDAILSENTPSFLDSIRLSTFTLGTKAPSIDGVKVYPSSAPDTVVMDWKISFIPNDILDLTAREAQQKVNPKIILTIRLGSGKIGAGIPILLEDIAFSGHIRVKLKLFSEMPHIKTIEFCFLEKPHFDYVLKPVGGETFGFDINNIPGLETFVKDQVHSNLSPMMYAPNVFTIDVAALLEGANDLETANGVLAVTVYSANNLKPSDIFGTLDPYCTFHVGNVHATELARTAAIQNTSHPKWNETCFVLLNNLNDILCVKVMDENSGSDSEIGVANLDLKDVKENNNAIEGLNLPVRRSGKPVGEIKADVRYFPVSKPEKKDDGTIIPPVDSNSGVVRFYIQDCKEIGQEVSKKGIPLVGKLPGLGSDGSSNINAYAILKVNGQEKLRTAPFKHSVNPRWNKYVEFFVEDRSNTNLNVTVLNSEMGSDPILGQWSSSLVDMQHQIVDEKSDWWNLENGSGKIHLDMTWKPIPLVGFSSGLTRGGYRPPIGVVRIKLNRATNLKNVEALTGGKSDPYVRVMSGLQLRGRTEAILDDLNPVWDTAVYIPIHSMREDLTMEVMDYNDIQSDKFLGMAELLVKDIVAETQSVNGYNVYEALPPIKRNVDLMNKERKSGRGQLNYEAAFFPTLALAKAAAAAEDSKNDVELSGKENATESKLKEVQAAGSNEFGSTTQNSNGIPSHDLHGEAVLYTADNKIDYLKYSAGVLSVMVHEVILPSKTKVVVDVMIDSNDPQFTTSPGKGKNLQFKECGDAFVKELDLSRLVVRVREPDEEDKRIAFWTSPVQNIVHFIQQQPEDTEGKASIQEFRLLECSGGLIRLSFKYTPVVKFRLDPSDSLENQGNLTVQLISASGLKAADRRGTSDPYCKFSLNGEKVYKSQTYKKQLSPVFKDEIFTVPIMSRFAASFDVKIYDWDQIGSHTLLAEGRIPIADLPSFEAKEVVASLNGGQLKLRLKWEPQLLARKRVGTSLLSATSDVVGVGGKALTGSTKLVGGAIGGGVGAIGGGIGAIGRGFNKLGGHDRKASTEGTVPPTVVPTEPVANAMASQQPVTQDSGIPQSTIDPSRRASLTSTGRRSVFDDKTKSVTIRVTLVEGKNLKGDPYCRVKSGKNTVHKTKHMKKNPNPQWNETFTTKIVGPSTLELVVKNHNLMADTSIGEVEFQVNDRVDEGQPFDGWLPLSPSGSGEIHIRAEVINP
ncbi:C2 domain-containing protein [Mycotypha africana]|uniref:C2 domain-containing protein n=1 Tax=Mycotypha africana TaxID=64632 RepID=UPI0023019F06|nr:C2 domain-containing protein [Mycotypha africana]KAI8973424.1 C2 domain-containing protein [Mycotypha africana]